MSKTILTEVSGWTPVMDDVVQEVGITAAMVFGKIWRYCQMSDGKCWASQDRIAEELNLSRHCVINNIKILIENGYIVEETPAENDHHRTNVYRDTGKAGMKISVSAGNDLFTKVTGSTSSSSQNEPVLVHEMNTKKQLRNNELRNNDFEDSFEERLNSQPPPAPHKPRTAEELRASALKALEEGQAEHAIKSANGQVGVNHFPPEVQATIEIVCDRWKIFPPYNRKASDYKFWIASAKDLKDACGEFGLALLDEVYEAWKEKGFFVSSPSSLVKVTTAVAGRKRVMAEDLPPAVDPAISYSWNSELSEAENMRLMREAMKRVAEREGREGRDGK